MKRTWAMTLLAFPIVFGLNACSKGGQTAGDRSSVEGAIKEYLDLNPACFEIGSAYSGPRELPATVYAGSSMKPLDEILESENNRKWKVFRNTGLVTLKLTSEDKKQWSGKVVQQPYLVVDLTEKGKKYYQIKESSFSGREAVFCYAKKTLKKIEKQSPLVERLGSKVVKVSYTYTLTDIPDWAKHEELQSVVREVHNDLSNENGGIKKDRAEIMKTENGWIHAAVFNDI